MNHKMEDDEEDDSRNEVGRLMDILKIPSGSYDGAFITNRRGFLHNEVNSGLPYQGGCARSCLSLSAQRHESDASEIHHTCPLRAVPDD